MRVDQYFENADLRDIRAKEKNPVTAGIGLTKAPVPRHGNAGADSEGAVDLPAAIITFFTKGTHQSLGTYLLSAMLPDAEPITVDGKKYELALRFKRIYKPYAVRLIEVRKDDYMGTSIARNYSSDIQLVDPDLKVDRKVHIKMNDPLRFAGDTFYQSGFTQLEDGTKYTVLSVVSNDVWMIPYVGCMIVVVGLLAHFLLSLTRFLRRQIGAGKSFDKDEAAEPILLPDPRTVELSENKSAWKLASEYLPWVAVAVSIGWYLSNAIPPSTPTNAPNYYAFGKLPLMYEGRIKPFDSLARNALRSLSGWQTFTDLEKNTRSASQWFLDTVTNPDLADRYKVFRIENLELLSMFGLDKQNRLLYSFDDLRPHMEEFRKQIDLAVKADKRERSPFQRKVLELAERVKNFRELQMAFEPLDIPPMITREEVDKNKDDAINRVLELRRILHDEMPQFHAQLAESQAPLAVPPDARESRKEAAEWSPYAVAVDLEYVDVNLEHREPNRATVALHAIFDAYKNHDVAGFNAAVAEYRARIDAAPPKPVNPERVRFEAFFNHFEPFYNAISLYGFGARARLRRLPDLGVCPRRAAESHRVLADRGDVRVAYAGFDRANLHLRSAARHESLFRRGVCRLGRRGAGSDSRKRVSLGARQCDCGRGWICFAVDRSLSGVERRHVHRIAGGARHPVLARHARGLRDVGLCDDICRRFARHRVHRVGSVHASAESENRERLDRRQGLGHDDLWRGVLRVALQFFRHRLGRAVGR